MAFDIAVTGYAVSSGILLIREKSFICGCICRCCHSVHTRSLNLLPALVCSCPQRLEMCVWTLNKMKWLFFDCPFRTVLLGSNCRTVVGFPHLQISWVKSQESLKPHSWHISAWPSHSLGSKHLPLWVQVISWIIKGRTKCHHNRSRVLLIQTL